VGGPGGRAFVAAGADHLGGLGVDQRLQHQRQRFADNIQATTGAQRRQQVGHGRLLKGHRGELLGVNPGRNTLSLTRWPLALLLSRARNPSKSTTPMDAYADSLVVRR
jgi:hypothetical protein